MVNSNMSGDVLVRGVNWVGDAVMTLPALRAIRKAMPGRKISLLVRPSVAPLFEKDPNIDEIITYGAEYRGILGRLRLARLLRKKGFGIAILLQNAFDAAVIALLARIPERVGYGRDGRGFLLTRPVRFKGQDRRMHHIDYYLEMLRQAGIEAVPSTPWVYLSLQERLKARETLKGLRRPLVGIAPGATYGSSKRWPPERFARVSEKVIRELGGGIVVFGSEAEAGAGAEILSAIPSGGAVSMAGKTGLRLLASLIAECDILLTNDSGPMHIAYAVGTPLVAIFGSTEPALTGPPPAGGEVVRKPLPCSPCFERECGEGALKCMEAVGPDEVFDAVKRRIPKERAVFFDRDGTLIRDADYLRRWEDFEALPGLDDLKDLKERGFKLIGVTNQSGVARGIVDEGFVREVNDRFIKEHGFEGFYYCPHHPDERCPCRKPEPEMAVRARLHHGIDLRRSYVVGDKEDDMLLAKAVGAKGILVLTGKANASENADFTVKDLKEAVRLISSED